MHREYWRPGINGRHGHHTGGEASQSGTSSDIGAVGKFPVWNDILAAQLFDDTDVGCICGIGLGYGQLKGNGLIQADAVFGIILLRLIGVQGMGNIEGEQESAK